MPGSPSSPMALNSPEPKHSMFRKSSSPQLTSAADYLSLVSKADARARRSASRQSSPASTPALSLSSSFTTSTEDTVLHESEDNNEDGLAFPQNPPTSEQVFSTVHTEFGHCANEDYRYPSVHTPGISLLPVDEDPPYYILLTTYISYLFLIVIGHIRDFFGKFFRSSAYKHLMPSDGYAPLTSDFDSFYTRRLKVRMGECFNQPVTGVAGRTIVLMDRISYNYNVSHVQTGGRTRALNISSYNYLGFAQAKGGCADAVEDIISRYGVSTCGARLDGGSSDLHAVTESLVAKFVGMEDAMISSMGFATNSTLIPALVSKGCLVISDELNHASIRFGVRFSGAHVRSFKHNDMANLEKLLREVISQGQPKTHRPWKKILLIVEGLYSMEGTFVDLPSIMELKKRYKFYLFLDEAHSIGALGPHGRGITDYFGVNPRDVDILMGTFTKSFGAAGGYLAGNKDLIDSLRVRGHSGPYAEAMTPGVLAQVLSSMASIMGISPAPAASAVSPSSSSSTIRNTLSTYEDGYVYPGPIPRASLPSWLDLPPSMADGSEGATRIKRLAFNSRYLARGLQKLGFITYGHAGSPIVPLLIYNPGKMMLFHRMMLDRQTPIITVVVAYPATPLVTSRVRFCVSGAHTKEDIDTVLIACDEVGDVLDLKKSARHERWPVEEIMARAVELVNTPE
ncbi:pyridoxal phosphate-dependent transferase [Flagelloscypha sp. PMI_526]|nr:pyridoxal phosphate-dependent transferase [Flagelloscypha sp. PMI_526]